MNKKQATVYQKAIRLIEGGHVEIDGLMVRAVKLHIINPEDFYCIACEECEMDCLCKDLMAEVCHRIYCITNAEYYLELVSK